MSEQRNLEPTNSKEQLNPEIIKRFQFGDIGMVLLIEDDLNTEDLLKVVSNSLSPLGLNLSFNDWQKLPDHLQEKLKNDSQYYISNPRHIFKNNSLNIFYNCAFREVGNEVDPKAQKEATTENLSLAYLIDFWAGGSGFLGPEKRKSWDDLNAKALVILTKSQFRKHIRGWTNRDVFTIPTVDWNKN